MSLINKVCCIGAGYVGGPTMAVLAQINQEIILADVDVNTNRIDAWNAEDFDNLPVYEPRLADIINVTRNRNLFFSTDVEQAIKESPTIFISVNTPTKEY